MPKPRKPLTRSALKEDLVYVNEGATEVQVSEEVHASSRKRVCSVKRHLQKKYLENL
jgi:hypothetical protein